MPDQSKPPAPESAAPPIVASFISEWVVCSEKEYTLLTEFAEGVPKISLFDFQMETLIYGLHCLDRGVFAYFGDGYRTAFMSEAFAFACGMFAEVLPEPQRQQFLEEFDRHCATRHLEYGVMKPLMAEGTSAMRNVLPYEFSKRLCIDAGVFNPPVQIALMEWSGEIMTTMLKVAGTLLPH